jgi:hypothetical protein
MTSGFLVTQNSVIITHEGQTHTCLSSHPSFKDVKEDLKNQDFTAAVEKINLATAVNNFGEGRITVVDGQVFLDGILLTNKAAEHIIATMSEGFDAAPMIAFLENLQQNPSKRAVDELYDFICAASIPITNDGHILAYKKVRRSGDKLVDIYSGKFDNSVGTVVEMPRNSVDEDKDRTCSAGLHFCSQSYLPHFGSSSSDVVVIVKVNPRDVVAIPADYNNAKARCCRYEVVEVHPYEDYREIFSKTVMNIDEIASRKDYNEGYVLGESDAASGILSRDESGWSNAFIDGYYDGQEEQGLSKLNDELTEDGLEDDYATW